MKNDTFYSISIAIGTQNLVKFYLVLITLFFYKSCCMFYEE